MKHAGQESKKTASRMVVYVLHVDFGDALGIKPESCCGEYGSAQIQTLGFLGGHIEA